MKSATRTRTKPVRFTVVGLGPMAQIPVLLAFNHAANCMLTAFVTDEADTANARRHQRERRGRVARCCSSRSRA